jgi:hypothetical protein
MNVRTAGRSACVVVSILTALMPALTATGAANAAVRAAPRHTDSLNNAPVVRVIKSNSTGRCLDDSSGFGLRFFPCNGLQYQKFDVYNNPNGTRYLVNRVTGRCVEDATDGSGLRARNCNGAGNQMWYVSNWGGGGWGFSNKGTSRCVYSYVVARNTHVWGVGRCNWSSRAQSFSLA